MKPQTSITTKYGIILPSCVEYEAEPFTGKTLPRKTGYSTGVTNDWLYFNLENGNRYNVLAPNRDIKEGQPKDSVEVCMDWDIAFCGYRVRTNSGTSGPGKGGAVDLGYGGYETWTSKSQVWAWILPGLHRYIHPHYIHTPSVQLTAKDITNSR